MIDPLTKADNYGWGDTGVSGNIPYGCAFIQGAYYAFTHPGYFGGCAARVTNFSDFAYQVQMAMIRGHSGGLNFRCNLNPAEIGACFYFRISIDGTNTYLFEKYLAAQGGGYSYYPITSGTSGAIRPGLNRINTLTVIARGSTFYLYINGQYVKSANDTTYRSGAIGVYADADADAAVAVFRNVEVWTL